MVSTSRLPCQHRHARRAPVRLRHARNGAVRFFGAGFIAANVRNRQYRWDCQRDRYKKDSAAGQQISARAHSRCGNAAAGRRETSIAPQAQADGRPPDETQADSGDRGTQYATAGRLQDSSQQNNRKDRPSGISEGTDTDRRHRHAGNQSFRARPIDERPARDLTEQCDNSTDRQDEANFNLGPFLCRQIHGDEGAKSGLHVGQGEDEPIERASATRRRFVRAHPRTVRARRLTIVDGIDQLCRMRKQVISPVCSTEYSAAQGRQWSL